MKQYRFEKEITFWDGSNPKFDASILMTAYQAKDTLEESLRSILEQKLPDNYRVQLIISVDPSTDTTLSLARKFIAEAPKWLAVQVVENPLPNMIIGGRRTARSNFLYGYSLIRGNYVFYLNCDDAWRTDTKLEKQMKHMVETGRACCTSLETEAPVLKKINDLEIVKDPFAHGNTILISSFAMPYLKIGHRRFWWECNFLDWPLVCYCWQKCGVDRLTNEITFYRLSEKGSWSSQDKFTKYRLIMDNIRVMLLHGPYNIKSRYKLYKFMRQQKPPKTN